MKDINTYLHCDNILVIILLKSASIKIPSQRKQISYDENFCLHYFSLFLIAHSISQSYMFIFSLSGLDRTLPLSITLWIYIQPK